MNALSVKQNFSSLSPYLNYVRQSFRKLTDNLLYYNSLERKSCVRIQQEVYIYIYTLDYPKQYFSQRFMRKREVHISMFNIYIVVLNLGCHSLR